MLLFYLNIYLFDSAHHILFFLLNAFSQSALFQEYQVQYQWSGSRIYLKKRLGYKTRIKLR